MLLTYVAHHLQQGVSTVWLFLDAPDPEFEKLVADKPRVKVVNTDAVYWQNEHGRARPKDFRGRQIANAQWAYENSQSEWLAHIDADEFITRVPELTEFLDNQPAEILTVCLWNAERAFIRGLPVRNVYGGVFRAALADRRNALTTQTYGADVRYLNFGIAGYSNGKSISRVGKGMDILLHRAVLPGLKDGESIRAYFDGFSLLHYDGLTRDHWVNKMLLRAPNGKLLKRKNKARINQIVDTWHARNDVLLQDAIYRAAKTLSLRQLFLLFRARKVLPKLFNVSKAVALEFPDLNVDFSPKEIDRQLALLKTRSDEFAAPLEDIQKPASELSLSA